MNNKSDEPYNFLSHNIEATKMKEIYHLNDTTFDEDKPDYSNVIPYIEQLEIKQ